MTVHAPIPALQVGDRLPELTIPSTPAGAPISLRRRGRMGTVVVVLHSIDCAGCLAFLGALAESHASLLEWDGRVVPIVPAGLPETIEIAERHALPFPLAADPERRVAERCGLASGGLLIADQWGELFLVEPMPRGAHSYPEPAEVAEWLRFVAIQCPECQGEAR